MSDVKFPSLGTEILRAVGNEDDPNWPDVRPRDVPKYLRERHWIRQWSGNRLPRGSYIGMHWKKELRASALDRALDDPGDTFIELTLSSRRLDALIAVRTTWSTKTAICKLLGRRDIGLTVRYTPRAPNPILRTAHRSQQPTAPRQTFS